MPDCLKAPWTSERSEIRYIDVPAKNWSEFESYVNRHTGKGSKFRFYKGERTASSNVKISFRSHTDIMRMLNNYICSDPEYSEFSRNCQTFASDFYGFLVNDNRIEPYASLNRVGYKSKRETFLYDYEEEMSIGKGFVSSLSKKKKEKKKVQRKSKKDDGTHWGDHWESD